MAALYITQMASVDQELNDLTILYHIQAIIYFISNI